MFGERIRRARHAASLSQYELAQAISMRPETVSAYERGVNLPLGTTCAAIAAATGCDLTWLITGAGDPSLPAVDAAPDADASELTSSSGALPSPTPPAGDDDSQTDAA